MPKAGKSSVAEKPPVPAKKTRTAAAKKPVKAAGAATPKQKAGDKAKAKPKRAKMVRDSFTMPENEYKVLGEVKRACLKVGVEIKKSQLLRIGVELVRQMEVEKLKDALATLTPLKAGRPKKEK